MNPYLQLMRIPHYAKNIVIFLPLIFGGELLSPGLCLTTILGFLTFCGISSVVYIMNDIRDAEKDRLHHTKCNRPIASGKISVRSAQIFAILLLFLSILLGFTGFGSNLYAWILLFGYVAINICYSLGLKNIPLVDITIITAGFLLRVLFGAVITDITISKWLFITIIAVAFYLSLYKRKNEFTCEGSSTRTVLKSYTQAFLERNLLLCLTLALVFYSLWCIDEITIARFGSETIVWTVPLVLLICLKYQLNDSKGKQDPIEIVLKDKILLGLCTVYGVIILLIVYGPL